MSFKITKKVTVKARLLNNNQAIFSKAYHENKLFEDTFYKIIKKISNEQLMLSRVETKQFKFPYYDNTFTFKNNFAPCYNYDKVPCIIDDLINRDVIIDIKIMPYDFVDKSTKLRRVGVSLTALCITGIRPRL